MGTQNTHSNEIANSLRNGLETLEQAKTALSGEIEATKTALNGKIETTKTDLFKTQVDQFTGYDNWQLFSITPLEYHHGGLSAKWTLANGAGVPISTTAEMTAGNGFDLPTATAYLSSSFVTNFNNSIDALNALATHHRPANIPAKVAIRANKLWVPNLISYGAFMRAGSSAGTLQGDAIRNIRGRIGRSLKNPSIFDVVSTGGAFIAGVENNFYAGQMTSSNLSASDSVKFDASRKVPTASENRPKNIQVPIYIKIK